MPDHLERRQDDCQNECDEIISAADGCPDDACFCPTAVALGPACSDCLVSVNTTAADIIGSAVTGCESEFPTLIPSTGGAPMPTSTGSGSECPDCSILVSAIDTCLDYTCLCPTALMVGPSCSDCLVGAGDVTDAVVIASYISACETGPPMTMTPPPSTATASIGNGCPDCVILESAFSYCPDDACFCSTALMVGSACSNCLVASNDMSDAATISYYVSSICEGASVSATTTTPTGAMAECSECQVLDFASSSCADDLCFCSTAITVGPACASCLNELSDSTDASSVVSVVNVCESDFPFLITPTTSFTQSASSQSSTPVSIPSLATVSRSGAFKPAELLLERLWIHVLLSLSFVAGFFLLVL